MFKLPFYEIMKKYSVNDGASTLKSEVLTDLILKPHILFRRIFYIELESLQYLHTFGHTQMYALQK